MNDLGGTFMTVKEYLSQAYRLDQRINSKIEQLKRWQDLAIKATSTLSKTSNCSYENRHKLEDNMVKIIDLKYEINNDIDRLIDLKKDIMALINAVKNPEYQTLLELRYLCFKKWEQIAVEMDYSIQHIFRIHNKALEKIKFF